MTRKQLFICDLLQRREIGYLHRDERQQLISASIRLADKLLVHNNEIKTIPCIDDRSRSSYMADTNTEGIAAMTHSNRCISLIDTGTMKRTAEINGLTRTIWTLCFHPYNPHLLATGSLGGTVCVFNKTELIQSETGEASPITSISFHSKEPLIFFSIDNKIVIWNYKENIKVTELLALEDARIKYVKYNPINDMLITGIRRENQISYFNINDEPDENHETRLISCSSFLDHLMRSLSSIIDNMDPNTLTFVNLEFYWSHILMHTKAFYTSLTCAKAQLQPKKFIGDFNISLILMQNRVQQIAGLMFGIDSFTDHHHQDCNASYPIESTLEAIKYILRLYKKEIEPFDGVDDFQFAILVDIIRTIHRILGLDNFSNLIRKNVKPTKGYQNRLQAWNMSKMNEAYLPDFSQNWRNLITYCFIHNDSTVELSKCGKLIASFELAFQEKIITIHSLEKSSLGQYICSYASDIEEILMSLSFSPSSEYLLVGVRSSDIFGYFLRIPKNQSETLATFDQSHPKWIYSTDDGNGHDNDIVMLKRCSTNQDVISYLKWSARSGDGIIIGYKTYHLRCLIRR